MTGKLTLAVALMLAWAAGSTAQTDAARRDQLQQAIAGRYRLTQVGPGVLGLRGNRATIRKVGGVVTLRRGGIEASFARDDPASYAIGGEPVLYRGRREVAVAAGEKFYVHSVGVGTDVVTLGLVSVRDLAAGIRTGQVWLALSFAFAGGQVARGDLDALYTVLDEWVLPEGAYSAPPAAIPAPTRTSGAEPPGPALGTNSRPVQLKPGMSRAEVEASLGLPHRAVTFGLREWLSYPALALAVVLEGGKLTSVESAAAPARLSVTADAESAEVYVDGTLAGMTPAVLELPPGTHRIRVTARGRQGWEREIHALSGSQVSLAVKLAPVP